MKPSGQPRAGGAPVGLSGGWTIGIVLTLFAVITFPPLGVFVLIALGVFGVRKLANAERRRRARREHAARMEGFYGRCDEQRTTAEWSNPGWRL